MDIVEKLIFPVWNKLKISVSKIPQFPVYRETRTHILFWYVALMIFFVGTAIPLTQQRLYGKVNQRVKTEMQEEIEEFEELLIENLLESAINQPSVNPSTGSQKERINRQLYQFFDNFIDARITEDDNYLIAIVDGHFYKSSYTGLPSIIRPGSSLMKRWQNLTEDERNEVIVSDKSVGSIIYKAIPIKTTDEILGVFVIAHATAGERKEALEALNVIIEVLILILMMALLIAWFASGRVLAPLRKLANAVKSISETDMSQRIEIRGKGELAELATTFNQMMNRLEDSFATQRNFINDAGHELRTPITIIRGHLELMDDDPEERQKTLSLVMDELDRMNRLVEDLVLLAKAERSDFLQLEMIDISSFTQELFNKIKTLGNRNWCIDEIAQGTMKADRQRLTQAIINLANNGVRHTATNNTIALGSRLNKGNVEFWLRDTGQGIPLSEQKRIFERFARVQTPYHRSEGSGLGLSIVKAIVEAHGGSINLRSNLGLGSTFTLIFPL